MSKKSQSKRLAQQLVEGLKELLSWEKGDRNDLRVTKRRAPIKPTKRHRDKSKYTRKAKHKKRSYDS